MERSDRLSDIAEKYDEDAPAAVLTTSQREYVLGENDYTGNQARAIESRIRNRLKAALYDFELIWRALPDEEIRKMLSERDEEIPPYSALASWLYRLQPENTSVVPDFVEDEEDTSEDYDYRAQWTAREVSKGITKAIEHREEVAATVRTSIEVERDVSLDELAERDLTKLSGDRLKTLLRTGKITPEEYGEVVMAGFDE